MLSVMRHMVEYRYVLTRFWKDEKAAVGTEYALLLGVTLMGMALAMSVLSDVVAEAITAAAELLRNGPVPPPP